MSDKEQEWFIQERARLLAGVYLTRRKDLVLQRANRDIGLEYIVSIASEDGQASLRQFGVFVRGGLRPTTEEQLNRVLRPTMQSFLRIGQFPYPVCLLYFTIHDNQGHFTWVAEPVVVDGAPQLVMHEEAHCRKLDEQPLDELVTQVDRWYDAFFARIAVKMS